MAEEATEADSKIKLNKALEHKAQLEARLLAEQFTPSHQRIEKFKVAINASGLVAAIATLVGLFGGAWQYLDQREKELRQQEQARQLRIEERMDRALMQLAEARAPQRAAAVASLHSFIDSKDAKRNIQVLSAFASALPLEKDSTVRNAILAVFEESDGKTVGKPALDYALNTLVGHSRGMVRETNLWVERPDKLYAMENHLSEGTALQTTARAITALLHKGARIKNMSGIYLGRSILSGLDLSEINFDDSILAWSDFRDAKLVKASFDNADLDYVRFIKADLTEARLISEKYGWSRDNRMHYTARIRNDKNRHVVVHHPAFRCANLTRADFSGSPILNMSPDKLPGLVVPFIFSPPKFAGANLTGTKKLGTTYMLVTAESRDYETPVLGDRREINRITFEGHEYIQWEYAVPANSAPQKSEDFSLLSYKMSSVFRNTNWHEAELSDSLRHWLESEKLTKDFDQTKRENYCREL